MYMNLSLQSRYEKRLGASLQAPFSSPEHDLHALDLSAPSNGSLGLRQEAVITCCSDYARSKGFDRIGPVRHLLVHSPSGEIERLTVIIWGNRSAASQLFMNIGPFTVCSPALQDSFPTGMLPCPTLFTAETERRGLLDFHQYTWAMLALLSRKELRGMHVVDLGAGRGALGVSAKLFGAKRVTLLDKNSAALFEAGKLCLSHGLKKGSDFSLIRGDLQNRWRVAGIIKRAGEPEQTAVMLNLGIWPSDYSVDNFVLFRILQHLGRSLPKHVVLGGYARNRRAEDTKIISDEVRAMRQLGYQVCLAATSFSLNPVTSRACPGGAAFMFERA